MAVSLPFAFDIQFLTDAGAIASLYKLHTYDSGTTTPKATYTDSTGTTPNANPITLNSAGRCSLWLGSGSYSFELKDAGGTLVKRWDGVSGFNSSSDLGGVTGANLIGYSPTTSYASGTVGARLAMEVSIEDSPFLASPSKTAAQNDVAIQAAIDSLVNGGTVIVPPHTYAFNSIRLDGSSGTLSNIRLRGVSMASHLQQAGTARASGVPCGDTTQSPNAIAAYSGSGFKVETLKITANKDTGGLKPKQATAWVGGTTYTYDALNPQYVQTKSDGTAIVTEAASDKVWKLLSTHTANATDIDVDVALGRWVQVDQTTGECLNGWNYDESFNRHNAIAFYGTASAVSTITVRDCEISGAIYAGVLRGSGPVKAGLKNYGVSGVSVFGNRIENCAAGVGGAVASNVVCTDNYISATGNLINVDEDGDTHTISGNVIVGDPTDGGRNGVSSYKSRNITTTGNTISGCQVGINYQDTGSTTDRGGSISGNTVLDSGQVGDPGAGTGIAVGASDHCAVSANQIVNCYNNSIKVRGSSDVAVTGNQCNDAGAYGIDIEDCVGWVVSGNSVRTCGRDCIYIEGGRNGTVSGNSCINGNEDDSATLYSGIRIGKLDGSGTDSVSVVVTGNSTADIRTPKQQHYGLNIETGTTAVTALGNNFLGSKTGAVLNNGTQCNVGFNQSTSGSFRSESTILPDTDVSQNLGASTQRWGNVFSNQLTIVDGVSAPSTLSGHAQIFVSSVDGDLKVIFGDGTVKTIVTDT